ncbi:NAD(P)-dependent oxidoreductase [Tersicoccus sp. Bi-70]|uniref:NAD(P)-dependent oxidoreductase n=1 Tax=Tersicoccus sp. Bi-70 TaxID=1897634 RepID=UPI0009758C88|nr:NAD(P)-dependent oxidoreductase [Tersicoccus sp. Bi-70]OMH36709.1 hydroxyacid dehydrogenase [Tersicoccus sp. Bi-70]
MSPTRTLTVSVPERWMQESIGDVPGADVVVWDVTGPAPQDLADRLEAVVLPYARGYDGEVVRALPHLATVLTTTTGYDGVAEKVGDGPAIVTAAGVHAAATAELAVALVLASLRGIDVAARDQAQERWRPQRRRSLADRRVLLVGVGGIGEQIARRLDPFEVTLTRVASHARTDERGPVHGTDELIDLAADHDVLIAITPLSEQTHHLVDARVLAALPDDALVVNVGRGAVVDTEALTAEVTAGRLHAALDVVDPEPLPAGHPLWSAPNALITPHVGGNASAFEPRIVEHLRRTFGELARGEEPATLVRRASH